MSLLTLFGLFAVIAMLVTYALEAKSNGMTLAFGGSCLLGATNGFPQGAGPFGQVEGVLSLVAIRKWWQLRGGGLGAAALGWSIPV